MFSDYLDTISWEVTTQRIMGKTDADVRRALAKSRCDVEDFMALISPAAEPYLEQMAQLSRMYTRERFGNTVSLFIPIYITNSCTNSCVYCSFHISNKMPRIILTPEEILDKFACHVLMNIHVKSGTAWDEETMKRVKNLLKPI